MQLPLPAPAPVVLCTLAPPLHVPMHFVTKHPFNRSMQGPQCAMLVHLGMMLSAASGWVLPSADKAHDSPLSFHESAITGGADGARARRQLIASSCEADWSVCQSRLSFVRPFLPLPDPTVAF